MFHTQFGPNLRLFCWFSEAIIYWIGFMNMKLVGISVGGCDWIDSDVNVEYGFSWMMI